MTTPAVGEPLDHTFSAILQGDMDNGGWTVVIMPGSQEFFGTGRAVKVVATVDGERFTTSLLPFGKGAGVHMLPIKAAVRKAIGKESGAEVVVHLERRLS